MLLLPVKATIEKLYTIEIIAKKGFGCVKRERIILKNELNDLFVLVLLDHLDALAVVELDHFLLLGALAALLQSAQVTAKTHH